MAAEHPNAPKKKPERGKDSAGHEFAGEGALTERMAPPRPAPTQSAARPVPRPPHATAPATPPKAPDPSIAGSKYFTSGGTPPTEPRQMSSIRRERSTDSDAFDSTLDDDLGEVTRRRDRERAAQPPGSEEAPAPPPSLTSSTRKDLDAEARPRELDFSAPDMPRKRRP